VSGAADADYSITYTAGKLTVTPAPLTITADNKTMTQGGPLPALTASYQGFVNGDAPASLTVPVTLTTDATAASSIGDHAIHAAGAAAPNYAITFVDGTLAVLASPAVQPPAAQPPTPQPPGATPGAVATVGAFDPATGTWYLKNSNTPGAPDA